MEDALAYSARPLYRLAGATAGVAAGAGRAGAAAAAAGRAAAAARLAAAGAASEARAAAAARAAYTAAGAAAGLFLGGRYAALTALYYSDEARMRMVAGSPVKFSFPEAEAAAAALVMAPCSLNDSNDSGGAAAPESPSGADVFVDACEIAPPGSPVEVGAGNAVAFAPAKAAAARRLALPDAERGLDVATPEAAAGAGARGGAESPRVLGAASPAAP
jgi:hypothetical protein